MISVVTITFNNFDELQKTIQSVEPIKNRIEHIIINGGSCTKTKEFLQTYDAKIVNEPDRGISDAFNKGIKLATGDGVVFLNSGDLLLKPDYLDWADRELSNNDFTYADVLFEDRFGGVIRIKPHGQAIGRGMPFPHQTVVAKRSIFDQIGEFDLNLKNAMCFDFACRMQKAGYKGSYYSQPVVLNDGMGVSSANESKTIQESRRALISNGLWTWENRIYFYKRLVLFNIRQGLVHLGLGSLLGTLKRIVRR